MSWKEITIDNRKGVSPKHPPHRKYKVIW